MTSDIHLRKEQILLNLEAGDRFSAFEEMVAYLVKIGDVPFTCHQDILGQLRQREEQTTFAVGRNLAIPHINGANVKKCTFLYARSVEGIEFGSCDTGLIHHLFLALIPEDKKCGWLKTLASMARALSNVELRDSLMNLGDRKEACDLLDERLTLI